MSAATMVNLITKDTTKKEMRDVYKNYPDTQPRGFESFHASTVEPMFCEVRPGSKVLDVGCNSGEMMKLLQDAKGCDVYGVDISDVALRLAKKKKLRVRKASAESIPYPDQSFDVVILREVLVHIHEPLKALKEIKRVLKPSGFLLGSAPHANLEKMVFDDKRLHHRYYDEETLLKDLNQVFEMTHLRVLSGAQFAVSMANSLLGEEKAEILWKSGNVDVPEWEHDLKADTKTLRVWMGPTVNNGTAYYRMIGFANKMRQQEETEIAFEDFSWMDEQGACRWQSKVVMNQEGQPVSSLALHHFESCLKIADPWIFQVTGFDDILMLFEAMKEAFPEKKLITETDDWIFDVPAYNIASHPYKPNSIPEQIAYRQIEISDAVICSTSFIKERLQQLFPEKKIYIVPNAIDFQVWDNVKALEPLEKPEGNIRIIYTGCGNHGGDMEIVKPVLLALLEDYKNLDIVMTRMRPEFDPFKGINHPRIKIVEKWAPIHLYPSMIKGWNGDIGIAPLRDNDFNRAKSNLRWLEYSALAMPTVASAVRPFTESIQHGVRGFLCKSKSDWYEHLNALIKDKSLRQGIGQSAYNEVRDRFNMDTVARDYRSILQEIKHERK